METLLNALLIFRSFAVVACVLAFTAVVLLGSVLAVDELREFLGRPVTNLAERREEAQRRKDVQDEIWADFFSTLPRGFEDTGEIKARDYLTPINTPRFQRDDSLFENWEQIRNDLR
jgi:hypothetical protein